LPTALARLVVFAFGLIFALSSALAAPPPKTGKLLLSHIACLDEASIHAIEVHFVVNQLPAGVVPVKLTVTADLGSGPTTKIVPAPTKVSGPVYHYSIYGGHRHYEILGATVELSNGATLNLHNPGEYTGDYDCDPMHDCTAAAMCGGWEIDLAHALETDAQIRVYAMVGGVWKLVAQDVASAGVGPGVFSGTYALPVPAGATDIWFRVLYDGKFYSYLSTKPDCDSAG
jgi:hypothetical protein